MRKKEDENMQLKAEKEILMQDFAKMSNSNTMQTSPDVIIKYEQRISDMQK